MCRGAGRIHTQLPFALSVTVSLRMCPRSEDTYMDNHSDKSILQQYPVETLYISALVLALIGTVLMLTVVGSIVGLPLLLLAAILGLFGYRKSRRRNFA